MPTHGNEACKQYVIYRCVVGSRAYGLAEEGADTDRRGIYLPPASWHWSLAGVPDQVTEEESQDCYWELKRFLQLALQAKPNLLECLYTPVVEFATPLAEELLALRTAFLSRLAYQAYADYGASQYRRLQQTFSRKGDPNWKAAMHLLRLLSAGATVLREGRVPVRVEGGRDELLAVRKGQVSWKEFNQRRRLLEDQLRAAHDASPLPALPDSERVEAFLIRARKSMV